MVRVRRRSISAEQVDAKPAAVGGAALNDAIGVQSIRSSGSSCSVQAGKLSSLRGSVPYILRSVPM
jgi:hypothetical protein